MKKQSTLFTIGLLLFPLSNTEVLARKIQKKDNRPNILYIMPDDYTSQAVGAYGSRLSSLNPSPTIDRIGNEGMIFKNCFCTNSISSPSRACIISGQYSQTNGILELGGKIDMGKEYLPIELNKLGYQTALFGKWHLSTAPDKFTYYIRYYGQGKYFNPEMCEKGERDSILIKNKWTSKKVPGRVYKGWCADVLTDATLDWFKHKRDKNKPFLVMLHYKAPHDMFEYAPRYENYLANTHIPEPASLWNNQGNGSIATRGFDDSLIDTIGSSVGRRSSIRSQGVDMGVDTSLAEPAFKEAAYQKYLKAYLRCVKGVDDNIKRVFDYLEANNLMDNTIIVFTGDQGMMLGEHDYIDKRWMYEESMRMPFMVRYPKKIKAGSKTDAIINNVDFAPTLITLAGGEVPEYMQGHSFKPILYTGKEPEGWQQATYYRYWMHMAHHENPAHFGIRTKRYKLIFFYSCDYKNRKTSTQNNMKMYDFRGPVGWEFYDLKNDPYEMHNLYGDQRYTDVIINLKHELKALREKYNETDAKYPEIQKIIQAYW